MDLKSTGPVCPRLTLRQSVRIPFARDAQIGTALADALNLGGRGHARNKYSCRLPQTLCCVRDSDAMIPTGRGDDARSRHVAEKQIRERSTDLERAGVLQ